MIYTIPWLPTTALPHPWARAWGSSLTEWAVSVTDYVMRALVVRPLGLVGAGGRVRGVVEQVQRRVEEVMNLVSSYLLDHTAW